LAETAYNGTDLSGLANLVVSNCRPIRQDQKRGDMAFEGGPYIQAACFCDTVIEDKTGVLSLIRIVDTVTHTAVGASPPEDMPEFPYAMKLVLMLKSGMARGRSNLRIVPQLPTGETEQGATVTAYFEGEEKGQNVITNINYIFRIEGLYWFKVYLDETLLTAIPLRVKYDRAVIASAPRS
jgi:hypothetical protein